MEHAARPWGTKRGKLAFSAFRTPRFGMGGGGSFWRDSPGQYGTIRDFNHLQLGRSMLVAGCWMLEAKPFSFFPRR